MFRGLDTGFSGQIAATTRLDAVSDNIANLQSTAFKRTDTRFQDVFYQTFKPAGVQGQTTGTPLGKSVGRGARLATATVDFTIGPLNQTGLPMDIAINGRGFFRVRDLDGNIFYTRNGSLQPKAPGSTGVVNIQTARGPLLLDPPITIPPGPGVVSVQPNGVFVKNGVALAPPLELVQFRNPDGLQREGDLLFVDTVASGPEIPGTPNSDGFGSIADTTLEGANTDLAFELVDLLEASQAFELNSQAVTAGNDELLEALRLAQTA